MASGATDVLAGARVVATLDEALDGITYRLRHGDDAARFRPADLRAARAASPRCAGGGHRVAFVFGSERFGMSNDDVYRCHAVLTSRPIPLRLAQPRRRRSS